VHATAPHAAPVPRGPANLGAARRSRENSELGPTGAQTLRAAIRGVCSTL
jgi:hypothetical protein